MRQAAIITAIGSLLPLPAFTEVAHTMYLYLFSFLRRECFVVGVIVVNIMDFELWHHFYFIIHASALVFVVQSSLEKRYRLVVLVVIQRKSVIVFIHFIS